jgi:hypothetical protein
MASPEESGRALLKTWHTTSQLIRVGFSSVAGDVVFAAFGIIAEPPSDVLHVSGKAFDLVCDLRRCAFEDVASEDLLRKISADLVGKQPETITLVLEWNNRLVLTKPSKLPS